MIVLNANAKINLTLDILGKRTDGYHEVAMVMQEISLHDVLTMDKQPAGISLKVQVQGQPGDLPADDSNLCWKAAALMQREYGVGGVNIQLEKNIPMAAGLAGGSADAAAVLKGINQLYALDLSLQQLCHLGAQLGSDIPFCIMGGTMLATGRGEILRALPALPDISLVLAKPAMGVSTAWAYQTYDAGYTGKHPDNAAMESALAQGKPREIADLLCNVLEQVTAGKYKLIEDYKSFLLSQGALGSMMSGSGPTVFAIMENPVAAEKAAEAFKAYDKTAQVYTAVTVAGNNK